MSGEDDLSVLLDPRRLSDDALIAAADAWRQLAEMFHRSMVAETCESTAYMAAVTASFATYFSDFVTERLGDEADRLLDGEGA
ncbi:MAG: hypothetical protein M5T61_19005 [Acidimicrobiia bacterium]|nr:hypothetical protein [Acidimicrobiia bacterium]